MNTIQKAQVALESTVIAHGLPYPRNLVLAAEMEEIIRAHGAEPRTVGIIAGKLLAGLSAAEMELLAQGAGIRKVSRRDLPIVVARQEHGATTVATTMWIAQRAGIEVFATGGIGGVHRRSHHPGGVHRRSHHPGGVHRRSRQPGGGNLNTGFDISADLQELAQTPVIVVCAGAKAILDLPATLEYLETYGVTVVGWQCNEFPAFYSRSSGLAVDVRCDSGAEVVALWRAKQALGLPGGLLVAAPVPQAAEIPAADIDPLIDQALAEADERGLRSAQVTPYLLSRVAELSGERSLQANLALLRNNAHVAAQIAVALAM
ncbi:MAG: pseudouridine-5'-phosphate glycosidase [Caldilineaceae bacterium]